MCSGSKNCATSLPLGFHQAPWSGHEECLSTLCYKNPPSEPHHLQVLKPMRYMVGGTMLVSPGRASASPLAVRLPQVHRDPSLRADS